AARSLHEHANWREARLKETYCSVRRIRRLIGVESEIVQCAPVNRVGSFILCKRFAVPSNRACVLGNVPRCAAISATSRYIVVCPTRFLRRRVKPDVTDVDSRSQRHSERLNGAIEILIIDGVLIMPDAATYVGD